MASFSHTKVSTDEKQKQIESESVQSDRPTKHSQFNDKRIKKKSWTKFKESDKC